VSFAPLGLHEDIVHAVQSLGYLDPTPIQEQAIPIVLSGQDVIGSAQTGTGKTAAFALPILSKLLPTQSKTRALILEPTRELAQQVEEALKDYTRFTTLKVCVIYGGVGYGAQTDAIKAGADIIVATPGRLLDHLEKGTLSLQHIQHLVLDEADRMLDMGFMPDVRRIVEMCPKPRQTLLFSATVSPEIERLIGWAMVNPITINIGHRRSAAETVSHALYPVAKVQKFDLLLALLEKEDYKSMIVFTRTKDDADRIANQLHAAEHSVTVLHSNRSQAERTDALNGFRSGQYEVLVATDIASRGLDVSGVTHVVNYDVPQNAEDYVHRIGRTGRAQTEGDAFTLMTAEDLPDIIAIERFINKPIERKKLENFKYVYSAIFDEKASGLASKGAIRGGATRKGHSYGIRRR
jgi:ATP-dependent RNA helicase RhlE